MAYQNDTDLDFLSQCDNELLGVLVEILTKDKGEERLTENLTASEGYKRYYPNHARYWRDIAESYQRFGGNTFVNMVRGGGVLYREILCDVCDKLKVNYDSNAAIEHIEMQLLNKVLIDSIEKMTPEQLTEVSHALGLKLEGAKNLTPQAITAALQAAIRLSGFKAYQCAVIIANALAKVILGHGLSLGTNAMITKAISVFAGPIAWVITGLWTALDIAGPAYRVTIPATIQIACMRQMMNAADSDCDEDLDDEDWSDDEDDEYDDEEYDEDIETIHDDVCKKPIGIFYGTDGGDTEKVVEQIAEELREYVDVKIFDVAKASRNDVRRYENLIFASPTYGEGDLQSDWEDFLPKLSANDVAGKTIAFVGLGDQDSYGETFGEGISHIYQKLAHRAIVVGKTSTDGYQFESSKSVVRGKFIGLMIDEANQDDQTLDRIGEWVDDIIYKFQQAMFCRNND